MKTILALLLGTLVGVFVTISATHSASTSDQAKTVAGGGVTVKVTYLEQTVHESRFLVSLDTHSVNLDSYDLKSLALIRDDTGLVMRPTAVENKGSGHHREVVLTFPRPSNDRKWLEVVIRDVAEVKERLFRWDRQQD